MATSKRLQEKAKKPSPFFELPRELRDKVYHFAIDVTASNFASLFRLNKQSHEEAYKVMLYDQFFVLLKFSLPRLAEASKTIRQLATPRGMELGPLEGNTLKIDGNTLELNSTSGGCLAAFRHYRMIIDITMPGKKSRTSKASYVMIPSQNTLSFTYVLGGCGALMWPDGPVVRDLQYFMHFGGKPNIQPGRFTEKILTEILKYNWWSFTDVKIWFAEGNQAIEHMFIFYLTAALLSLAGIEFNAHDQLRDAARFCEKSETARKIVSMVLGFSYLKIVTHMHRNVYLERLGRTVEAEEAMSTAISLNHGGEEYDLLAMKQSITDGSMRILDKDNVLH